MIGEMRDVIDNLAVSINSLRDVVSDFQVGQNQARQNTGSGPIPVQGSGRRKGSRGRRGGGRGSVRARNQRQSTGGHVGDDYVADDESQGDEDHGESKDYKLRVSVAIHDTNV